MDTDAVWSEDWHLPQLGPDEQGKRGTFKLWTAGSTQEVPPIQEVTVRMEDGEERVLQLIYYRPESPSAARNAMPPVSLSADERRQLADYLGDVQNERAYHLTAYDDCVRDASYHAALKAHSQAEEWVERARDAEWPVTGAMLEKWVRAIEREVLDFMRRGWTGSVPGQIEEMAAFCDRMRFYCRRSRAKREAN